jgi:hypothetical protein
MTQLLPQPRCAHSRADLWGRAGGGQEKRRGGAGEEKGRGRAGEGKGGGRRRKGGGAEGKGGQEKERGGGRRRKGGGAGEGKDEPHCTLCTPLLLRPHDFDVAGAVEGVVHPPLGHARDHFLYRVAMLGRIHAIGSSHLYQCHNIICGGKYGVR